MTLQVHSRIPSRDLASKLIRESPLGSPLFPGGALLSIPNANKRVEALKAWKGDRIALHQWLTEQNSFSPLHASQQQNLEWVKHKNAVFVLTGQQPGLLGGPLLWFAKAHACIAHAKKLSQALQCPTIPIFWVAGDDSDLAECNSVELLESKGVSVTPALDFENPLLTIPMSQRTISSEALDTFFATLEPFWDKSILNQIRLWYTPAGSITKGFMQLAQHFLGSEGVLFVDGYFAAKQAQPLLQRLTYASKQFESALIRGSIRSENAGLGQQVSLRQGTVPVFLLAEEERHRLFFSDQTPIRVYRHGNESVNVLEQLETQFFTHSALSRPLVAEYLFPVLGHILGPAELRYFAQLSDVFHEFGFAAPPLAARQQSVVCPKVDWDDLTSLGLQTETLTNLTPAILRQFMVEKAWEDSVAARDFPESAFLDFSNSLREYQRKYFANLGLDAGIRRMERAFNRFRNKAKLAQFDKDEGEAFTRFKPLLKWLGHGSQDRHLNLLSLQNRMSPADFSLWIESLKSADEGITLSLFDAKN